MKTSFFIIALLLVLIWTVGFIGYQIGGVFHGILILAIMLEATGEILDLRLNKNNET
jgi:hypothetical protein